MSTDPLLPYLYQAGGSLQLSSQQIITVWATLRYDTDDPSTLNISYSIPSSEHVWVLGLDLLTAALKAPQGDKLHGRVFARAIGRSYVELQLRYACGEFTLKLNYGDVLLFTTAANQLRQQAPAPDIDAELARLLS